MRAHEVKCWTEPFEAKWDGRKAHEIRVDDRDYRVGDHIRENEWDRVAGRYTGRWILEVITYKTEGGQWGIPPGLCVMSTRMLEKSDDATNFRARAATQEER